MKFNNTRYKRLLSINFQSVLLGEHYSDWTIVE